MNNTILENKKKVRKFYRTDLAIPNPPHFVVGSAGHITFIRKNAYGVERVYLTDPVQAAAIYDLTGLKTVLPVHMAALEALGFTFVLDTKQAKGEEN